MAWIDGEGYAAALRVARPYYEEPFRHYHDLAHPLEMVATAVELGIGLDEAQGLATLFHDAACAPGAPPAVSEEASAALLLAYAPSLGVDATTARRAAAIVLATDHAREPADDAAAAVVDLDLLRLAMPYPAFLAHSDGVHREWAHLVPDRAEFMRGRAAFLRRFGERPRIYRLGFLDEAAARANLARFVAEWG